MAVIDVRGRLEEEAVERLTHAATREAAEASLVEAAVLALGRYGNHSNCGDDAMGEEGPCVSCDHRIMLARVALALLDAEGENARLREALWGYREYNGHAFTNGNPDEGCIRGCPGCRADAVLAPRPGEAVARP